MIDLVQQMDFLCLEILQWTYFAQSTLILPQVYHLILEYIPPTWSMEYHRSKNFIFHLTNILWWLQFQKQAFLTLEFHQDLSNSHQPQVEIRTLQSKSDHYLQKRRLQTLLYNRSYRKDRENSFRIKMIRRGFTIQSNWWHRWTRLEWNQGDHYSTPS